MSEHPQHVSNFADTNWLEQFFWPFGRSSAAQFGRGWLMVVIGQIISVVIGLVLIFFETNNIGFALIFGGLIIGTWTVGILHIRRLHDRGRSGWLAFFVYLPLIAGMLMLGAPSPQERMAAAEAQAGDTEQTGKNTNRRAARQRSGGRGRGAASGPDGIPREVNVALQKASFLTTGFVFFAFFASLLSLLTIHRMPPQPTNNRWGNLVTLRPKQ